MAVELAFEQIKLVFEVGDLAFVFLNTRPGTQTEILGPE